MIMKNALKIIKFKKDKQLLVEILDEALYDFNLELETLKLLKEDTVLKKAISSLSDKIFNLKTFRENLTHDCYIPLAPRGEALQIIRTTEEEFLNNHITIFYDLELPEELTLYIRNLGFSPISKDVKYWVKEK